MAVYVEEYWREFHVHSLLPLWENLKVEKWFKNELKKRGNMKI